MTTALVSYWIATILVFIALFVLGKRFRVPLWIRIIVALLAGGAVGAMFIGEDTQYVVETTRWIGDLFMRLIRMLVVPLIFTTLISGVITVGNPKRLAILGGRTITLYLATTCMAVMIGLFTGTIINPGAGVDYQQVSEESISATAEKLEKNAQAANIVERLIQIVPENPVQAFVENDLLATIFFALLFGIGILLIGNKGKPVGKVIDSAAGVMLKLAVLVVEIAPYGVYALMSWVIGKHGFGMLENLLKLTLALYIACALHIFLVLGGLIRGFGKMPLRRFFRGIANAQAVAFSTASSSATLPVTIACVSNNLGVPRSVAGSVLPIGATINMDGSCIYIGLVALFAAQAFGIDLSFGDYVVIALTATLASIAGPGVPSTALFMATMVLGTIGVSPEQTTLIIALIFPFDRIFDMARTLTNVTGDATVATVIATRNQIKAPVEELENNLAPEENHTSADFSVR